MSLGGPPAPTGAASIGERLIMAPFLGVIVGVLQQITWTVFATIEPVDPAVQSTLWLYYLAICFMPGFIVLGGMVESMREAGVAGVFAYIIGSIFMLGFFDHQGTSIMMVMVTIFGLMIYLAVKAATGPRY